MEEDKNLMEETENQSYEGTTPARKFLKKPILIGAAIVAVVAVVLVIVLNPKVQNSIKKKTLSADNYYQQVEKKYIVNQAAQSATEFYGNYVAPSKKNGVSGNIKVTLGKEFTEVLSDALEDAADFSLSKFKNITLSYAYNPDMDNKKIGYSAKLSYNGDEVLPMEAIIDFNKEEVYFNITNLSSQYFYGSFDDVLGDDQIEALEQIFEAASAAKSLPNQKSLYKIVDRYLNLIIGQINNVEYEDNCTLSKGDVEIEVTQLKVKITEKVIKNVIKAVCKELEKDDELVKLIVDISELTGEEVSKSDVEDYIDELVEKLDDSVDEIEMDNPITMYVYVDAKGNVVGRKIKVDSNNVISFYDLDDGKNVYFGFEAAIKEESESYWYGKETQTTNIKAVLDGKKKSGKVNGDFTLNYENSAQNDYYGTYSSTKGGINVEVSNFSIEKFKKGEISGTFAISRKSGFKGDFGTAVDKAVNEIVDELDGTYGRYLSSWIKNLKLSFTINISDTEFDVKVGAYDDDDLLLEFATENKQVSASSIPKVSKKCDDMEEWLEKADWKNFFKKLKKTDLPKELIEMLEEKIDDAL